MFSAFLLPAVAIFIMYNLMGSMMNNMISDIEEHVSAIIIGNAPESFQQFYETRKDAYGFDIDFAPYDKDSVLEAIRNEDTDLLIEFEDSFDKKIQNYENSTLPEIFTYYNPANVYSGEARANFVYGLLEEYEAMMLKQRFGNLDYTKAFGVDITNENSVVVSEDKLGATFLSMILPMLVGMLLFSSAMGIGMDTIAGEKERGTMATLLLTPVNRNSIALGKIIGLGIIAVISSSFSFIAIILSAPNIAESMGEGTEVTMASLGFTPLHYLQLLVIMLTLVGMYVGIISLISVRARTVKEAGTYVTPVYLIIMMSAFGTMFSRGDANLYKFLIPIYGSITAIKEIFEFELSANEFWIVTAISIGVTALFVKLITMTFNDEKVMFNA